MRGQCYDCAATMSGKKSGVATRLCAEEPRAVFTHCYGHSLNLACGDAIKQWKLMRDALHTTHEITKLIKKSPARDAIFKRLREEIGSDTPGIRVLFPTRWTVRLRHTDNLSRTNARNRCIGSRRSESDGYDLSHLEVHTQRHK